MPAASMQVVGLCLLAASAPATAQITVMSPSSLASQFSSTKGRIEGSTTTIGAPFYGDRVLGQLVYAESTGNADQPYCSAEDYNLPDPPKSMDKQYNQVRMINIALVRRGGCSFSTKVKVAADKGAHAVIIVDKKDSTFTRSQMKNVVVAEDVYEDDVHIPSVFLCKEDGEKLINEYLRQQNSQKKPIVVELAWKVPISSVVTVDQWMSSASAESLKFLKAFAPKRRILNQVLRFKPHFTIFSMGSGGSAQTTSKLCTDTSGRFCAEDPDGDGQVEGKDVIEEDLRQICLHQTTKVSSDEWVRDKQHTVKPEYAAQYWSYLELFGERCPLSGTEPSKMFGDVCSYALMREVGVSEDKISSIQGCADPKRNRKELERQLNFTAWSPRALRINGWRYSGILDPELVASAVCAGFSKEPAECNLVKMPRDFMRPFIPMIKRGGVSFSTMIAGLLVILAVVGGAFFLYKQYMKKEMRVTIREEVMLEVEAAMGEYGKLKG